MRIAVSLTSLFFTAISVSYGQDPGNQIMQRNNFTSLMDGVGQYDYIYKKAPEIPGVNGSPYLQDTWSEAMIHLKDHENDYHVKAIKYDILGNRFEFNYDPEIKVLNGSKVQRFDLLNVASGKTESFASCGDVIKGDSFSGFCQVLAEGPVKLVLRKSAFMKNPTYNATLMVGTKEKEIIQTDEYYLSDDKSNRQIKNKGDIKEFFEELNFEIGEYKKASLKDMPQLVELVNHYNQSVKK